AGGAGKACANHRDSLLRLGEPRSGAHADLAPDAVGLPIFPVVGQEDVDREGEIAHGVRYDARKEAARSAEQKTVCTCAYNGGQPFRVCQAEQPGYDGESAPGKCADWKRFEVRASDVTEQERAPEELFH